jgi:hypothetical protein
MKTIIIKTLLAPTSTAEEATLIAEATGCSGFYLTIPPSMMDNVEEGDTFPLIVEEEYPLEEG